jgi:hypothetical protein
VNGRVGKKDVIAALRKDMIKEILRDEVPSSAT